MKSIKIEPVTNPRFRSDLRDSIPSGDISRSRDCSRENMRRPGIEPDGKRSLTLTFA
jgi:hypothetical protein